MWTLKPKSPSCVGFAAQEGLGGSAANFLVFSSWSKPGGRGLFTGPCSALDAEDLEAEVTRRRFLQSFREIFLSTQFSKRSCSIVLDQLFVTSQLLELPNLQTRLILRNHAKVLLTYEPVVLHQLTESSVLIRLAPDRLHTETRHLRERPQLQFQIRSTAARCRSFCSPTKR